MNPALLGEKHQCYHYAIQPPTSYIEGQKIQQKIKKKFSPCSFFSSSQDLIQNQVTDEFLLALNGNEVNGCFQPVTLPPMPDMPERERERERERKRERKRTAGFSWLGQPTAGDCLEEFSLDAKKQFLLEKNRLVRTCGESV